MNLQIVNDNMGSPQGVFIPIREWEALKLKYKIEDIFIEKTEDSDLMENLKKSLTEMTLIENGKLEKKSAFDLLDEL